MPALEVVEVVSEPVFKAVHPIEVPAQDTFRTDIEQMILETFPEAPIMVEVLRCESGLRQFRDDGSPVSSHTNDWGLSQINATVWDSTAQALGLNYKYSLEDNLKMARHVYEVQGISAWVCLELI